MLGGLSCREWEGYHCVVKVAKRLCDRGLTVSKEGEMEMWGSVKHGLEIFVDGVR